MLRRNKFMEYIVVSYRSRESTLKLHQILSNGGIACQVINTPKEAGVGCGLSVKIAKQNFATVKRVVFKLDLKGFAGFFAVSIMGGKRFVRSI